MVNEIIHSNGKVVKNNNCLWAVEVSVFRSLRAMIAPPLVAIILAVVASRLALAVLRDSTGQPSGTHHSRRGSTVAVGVEHTAIELDRIAAAAIAVVELAVDLARAASVAVLPLAVGARTPRSGHSWVVVLCGVVVLSWVVVRS